MKKITLLLFTLCAFAANAQISGSSSPAVAIPDNTPGGVTDVISFGATTGVTTTVEVDVAITHTWTGDLVISLTAPDGTTSTTLMDRPGVPASQFGCAGDDVAATFADAPTGSGTAETVCNDLPAQGPGPYEAGDATGNVIVLATVFGGVNATGNWTLTVEDLSTGDTGTFDSWTLRVFGPTLGLDDNNLEAFSFSPNPVKNTLNLNAAQNISNVEVYNLIGQQVKRVAPNTVTSQIDMSELNAGAYFIKVSVGDVTQTVKVIKE